MAKPKCRCGDKRAPRRSFGSLRILASGNHQARYVRPGTRQWVNAPTTFDTHQAAEMWLATVRADLSRGAWMPPDSTVLFGSYAETWLAERTLRPRTRALYRKLLDARILPTFALSPWRAITPAAVRAWHAQQPKTPTRTAHAYGLLATICKTAVDDGLLQASPCRIRGAGAVKRAGKTTPATLEELAVIVEAIPLRYRLMVLLAAWCSLRYGELTELRGKDIDTRAGIIHVRRGVAWVDGEPVVGTPDITRPTSEPVVDDPKSEAGRRDVAIPPHLLPAVRAHILSVGAGRSGLLWPAAHGPTPDNPTGHMRPQSFYRVYHPARAAAGREDLRFHDLRHTGAVLAAATGATIAELMARLGHSTPAAAMRYQHAAQERDVQIAAALSKLAEAATEPRSGGTGATAPQR